MLLDKIKYWVDKKRNPGKYLFEKEEKRACELAETMTDAIKPSYVDDYTFKRLKRSLAYKYNNNPNLDVLTDNANQIYALGVSPRIYRETALLKYLLKKATVAEFRIYLKMCVISDSNPRFNRSWEMDDHQHLIDALASGDIPFAQKYAQQNMRYLEPGFLNNQPEITSECSMHMLFRSLVLDDLDTLQKWLSILKDFTKKMPDCYALLPVIFDSIITRNNVKLTEVLLDFTKQHEQIFSINQFGETPKGDVIVNLQDKYLFIWGIAFLNFARYSGMDVCIEHHLVPNELLIPVNHSQTKEN